VAAAVEAAQPEVVTVGATKAALDEGIDEIAAKLVDMAD